MAHLNTFSPYWNSGSNTPSTYDARSYAEISYSQDKTNNKTTYSLAMYLQIAKNDSALTRVSYNFNSNISGTVKNYQGQVDVTGVGSWGTVYLGTQTYTVTHNDNGTGKQISYSINGAVNLFINGSWSYWLPSRYSAAYYHTAPTIARISTATNNTSPTNRKLFGEEITFTIDRKSSSFTHDLKVWLGTEAAIVVGENIGTSCKFTFPEYAVRYWTNTDEPNLTLTLYTKSGNTVIGTTTSTIYLRVPDSFVPTCTLGLADLGKVPTIGKIPENCPLWIKGQSQIMAHVTAEGVENSTIKNCVVVMAGDGLVQTYSTNEFTGVWRAYMDGKIPISGKIRVTVTVTDSRGRIGQAFEEIDVVDWYQPKLISYRIQRCDADGIDNEEGTYGKIVAQYDIAPVDNFNHNLAMKAKLGTVEKEYPLNSYNGTFESETYDFENLATNSNYVFQIYIKDFFESIEYDYNLTPSFVTVSYLNGGKGVTLGQVATVEGFHSYMDNYFHKKVEINQTETGVIFSINGQTIAEIINDEQNPVELISENNESEV